MEGYGWIGMRFVGAREEGCVCGGGGWKTMYGCGWVGGHGRFVGMCEGEGLYV